MADNEDKTTKDTPTKIKRDDPVKVEAILPSEFGLQTHRFKTYNAILPTGVGERELKRTELWNHVAPQLNMFDEIRAIAEDGSYVADLIVIYKFGNQVKVQVKQFTQLEQIDYSQESGMGRYGVKQRGQSKWCIIDSDSGAVIEQNIATQTLALKRLTEFLSTLAA